MTTNSGGQPPKLLEQMQAVLRLHHYAWRTEQAYRMGGLAVNWRQDGQDFQDCGGGATLPHRRVCNWGRAAARPYHESRCLVGDSRRSSLRFLFVSVADFLATKGPCGRPLLIEAGDFVWFG